MEGSSIVDVDPGTGRLAPRFTPLGDRVLVRRIDAQARTASGLYIPDVATEKLNRGEVVAAGAGVEASELAVGAVVVFGKYAGDEILLDDQVFVVLRECDVFGVAGAPRT